MRERRVARRVHGLRWSARSSGGPPCTPTNCAETPDPREAFAEQERVGHRPLGRRVEPAGHVQPLDEDGAVEACARRRSAHEDARRVRRRAGGRRRPRAVGRERRFARVARGRAGEEELLLDVAEDGEVEGRRGEGGAPRARDRSRDRGCRGLTGSAGTRGHEPDDGGDPREGAASGGAHPGRLAPLDGVACATTR